MVCLVSRTGRSLKKYNKALVVGCIPYRYKKGKEDGDELEVLVISSQKGEAKGMMFPKGGWELDEFVEEAGVVGYVEHELGQWRYQSKSRGVFHEACMFPLFVTQLLDLWPEKNCRQRRWMSASEVKQVCPHWWMKEALEILVDRLTTERGS